MGKILSELWGIKNKMKKPPEKRNSWKREKELGYFPQKISDLTLIEKFACSNGKNIFLGMAYNEKLIFGHTHRPFVIKNTANTGSWVKNEATSCAHNTYLKIGNGKIYLMKWQNGKEHTIKIMG